MSPLTILQHLTDTYGTVTCDDLNNNLANTINPWTLDIPLENLWSQFKKGQHFAANHDPITNDFHIHKALKMFEATTVFDLDICDWENKVDDNCMYPNFKKHFTNANKKRL